MDDAEDAHVPLSEGLWIAFLELLGELELETPGLSERLHDRIAHRSALPDVIRLFGPRTEKVYSAAYEDARRHVGPAVMLAQQRAAKRKRRR